MSNQHTYARFWRCALQVNPVAYNGLYRGRNHGLDESEYNQALLDKCIELDIKVVGLADHGSVTSVDALRKVLQPQGIIVFPGFEISSNDKTHYVCLFPEDTTVIQLERYLGGLDLLDPTDGIRPSRLSSEALIDKVDALGGFIYAAHCTQDSGLLKNRLNHVWKLNKLRAAQIPGSVDDLTSVEDGFYRKVILNKDRSYQRDRLIAVINAKDVAKPEDLDQPSATCFIKMTKPNFAAFKMAFLDPESRIRLNLQYDQSHIGKIMRMSVAGGYLDGIQVEFSDHLNTVIGGRGTGKSTLLECLRYALDLLPKGAQAKKIHQEIIKENLGLSAGRVELVVVSSAQNGKQYTVSRRHGEPPMVRDFDGKVSNLSPRDLLPGIDIYGQNEIYELAQDENSRVQLLDRFLPQDGDYKAKIADVNRRLSENQQNLTKSWSELDEVRIKVDRLPKLEEQLRGFDELGIKEKLAKTSLIAREREIARMAVDGLQKFKEYFSSIHGFLPNLSFISDEALDGLPDAERLVALRATLESLKHNFSEQLAALNSFLNIGENNFRIQYGEWQQAIQGHEADLEVALRALPVTAGKSGQEVGAAYQRLTADIERIKPMKLRVVAYESQIENLKQERRNLLAELSDLRGERIRILDNAFIANRIVSELREAKTKRQFLFATHNANIPVFGDAEWIGVFTVTDNHGCLGLDAQGSIDVPEIRDHVASILEGGRDAFIQRKEKYEF